MSRLASCSHPNLTCSLGDIAWAPCQRGFSQALLSADHDLHESIDIKASLFVKRCLTLHPGKNTSNAQACCELLQCLPCSSLTSTECPPLWVVCRVPEAANLCWKTSGDPHVMAESAFPDPRRASRGCSGRNLGHSWPGSGDPAHLFCCMEQRYSERKFSRAVNFLLGFLSEWQLAPLDCVWQGGTLTPKADAPPQCDCWMHQPSFVLVLPALH